MPLFVIFGLMNLIKPKNKTKPKIKKNIDKKVKKEQIISYFNNY